MGEGRDNQWFQRNERGWTLTELNDVSVQRLEKKMVGKCGCHCNWLVGRKSGNDDFPIESKE